MSQPWSELMHLIHRDNQLNPPPTAMPTQWMNTSQRYNPYATSASTYGNENDYYSASQTQWISNPYQCSPSIGGKAERSASTPTEFVPKYKNAAKKVLVRPLEDYGPFDPSLPLPEDSSIPSHNHEKKQFWFFLLELLVDSTKSDVIAWTGRGREFVIISPLAFAALWSVEQCVNVPIKFESIRRTMRAQYKRRIMIPTDAQNNRFAFHTEPSIHVRMTHDQLTTFIAANNTNSPPSAAEQKISAAVKPRPSKSRSPLSSPITPSIYPTPAPSAESFFDFSISAPTFHTTSFTSPPPSFAPPSHYFSPLLPPPTELPQFSDPTLTEFQSNEQLEPLPVIDVNESDFSSDSYWFAPAEPKPKVESTEEPDHFAHYFN